jgi:RNA polymerase sigma factor (TIGR02999 family)
MQILANPGTLNTLSSNGTLPLLPMNDATLLLNGIEQGKLHAAEELLSLLYDELRRLAAFKMAQQAPGHTLQATALVHEAWVKLVGSKNRNFKSRAHFFSAAAEAMRHILIDRARRKQAQRHGGGSERVVLEELELISPMPDEQLLSVNEALEQFAARFPTQAEVVKLRYFVGMTNEEIAQLLAISVSTVKNYWNFSRAWLFSEISGD